MGSLTRAVGVIGGEASDWPALTRLASRHETVVWRVLQEAFTGGMQAVDSVALDAAVTEDGSVDVDAVLAALRLEDGVNRLTVERVRPHLVALVLDGARVADDQLPAKAVKRLPDETFDAVNREAVRWARQHAGDLVVGPATVREIVNALVSASQLLKIPVVQLRRQLLALMRVGVVGLDPRRAAAVSRFADRLATEGIAEADRLRRVARYADAQRRARAWAIARTETASALSHGQQVLWDASVQNGHLDAKAMGKRWITTADDILCPECEALDGTVVPIAESFSGNTSQPPLHPMCRCATGLVPLPK